MQYSLFSFRSDILMVILFLSFFLQLNADKSPFQRTFVNQVSTQILLELQLQSECFGHLSFSMEYFANMIFQCFISWIAGVLETSCFHFLVCIFLYTGKTKSMPLNFVVSGFAP